MGVRAKSVGLFILAILISSVGGSIAEEINPILGFIIALVAAFLIFYAGYILGLEKKKK